MQVVHKMLTKCSQNFHKIDLNLKMKMKKFEVKLLVNDSDYACVRNEL